MKIRKGFMNKDRKKTNKCRKDEGKVHPKPDEEGKKEETKKKQRTEEMHKLAIKGGKGERMEPRSWNQLLTMICQLVEPFKTNL